MPDSSAAVGDVGCLFFTSGTTGPSKAVATTWHYLFSVAATVASAWEFGPGEVLWTAMPLFHLSAAPSVLAPMLVGGTTVLAGGVSSQRGVGRRARPRCHRLRRRRRDGVDAAESARGSA